MGVDQKPTSPLVFALKVPRVPWQGPETTAIGSIRAIGRTTRRMDFPCGSIYIRSNNGICAYIGSDVLTAMYRRGFFDRSAARYRRGSGRKGSNHLLGRPQRAHRHRG